MTSLGDEVCKGLVGSLNHIRTAASNHCLLLPSEYHTGGYQPVSHPVLHFFIWTSVKVSRSFPFPATTPDCPAALLQDLHLFALTDNGFEDQFRVILSFFPTGRSWQETSTSLCFSHSFMEAQLGLTSIWILSSLDELLLIYVLGTVVSIHIGKGYNASVPK